MRRPSPTARSARGWRDGMSRRLARLSRSERRQIGGMAAFVLALHLVGWVTLIAIVAPQHFSAGTKAFGIGIGATAYVLGMRHAFDADHIVAIDNTTRRLMRQGQRPLSVGFWFSLGHSTIVFALALLIAAGARALPDRLVDERSGVHSALSLIGTSVSGAFLLLIAALNLVAFVGIFRLFLTMRGGRCDEAELEARLARRGMASRLLPRLGRSVARPRNMYAVGLLFGLGFDTATEIALLVAAGTGAASGLPWYAILCLPVLFAAGMCLLDTLDGSFMNYAYGWALSEPVRKVWYSLTITGLSIAVAVAIAGVELIGLASDRLGLDGGAWSWVSGIDLNAVGFVIAAMFCVVFASSLAIWRYGRIEQRWTRPRPRRAPPPQRRPAT